MKNSLQKSVRRSVVAVLTFYILVSLVFAMVCSSALNRSYRSDLAESTGEFAFLTIDPDTAKDCLTLREANDEFRATQKKLADYQKKNSGSVKRISLVSFTNTAGNYIYDTGGKSLGSRFEYDEYTDSVRDDLMDGKKTWTDQRSGSIFHYRPVRTVDDRLAGYLIVELDDPFSAHHVVLISGMMALQLLIGMGLAAILLLYLKKRLFRPMQRFTQAAESIVSDEHEGITADNFSAERDDEIGQLGKALQKIFVDMSSGAENLSKAVYAANHDSMTQVLNKGSYTAMEGKFRSCGSVCVIYFDVNNLKLMNDTLGHEKGDQVIRSAAEYIRGLMTPADYCFRMGGDEFLMVMTECSYRAIDALAERLEADSPYILNPEEDKIHCALSYGYAYAKGEYSYDALLTEAEENMYAKKNELKALMQMPDR